MPAFDPRLGTWQQLFERQYERSRRLQLSDVPPGNYEVVATSGMDQVTQQVEVYDHSEGASVDLRLSGKTSELPTAGSKTSVSLAEYSVPPKARAAYEKAFKAFQHGKLDDAQKLTAEALDMYPRSPRRARYAG